MRLLLTLFIALTMLSYASAQDDGAIVIDDLSRPELTAEIEKIENELYRVWNARNDSDQFDINCTKYVPTASHRSIRTCEPKFLVDARSKNANDAQNGLDDLQTLAGLRNDLAKEFAELTKGMEDLAKRDTYFADLVNILGMLRERLTELE